MASHDCRHPWDVYEPNGFDHCLCGHSTDAKSLWSYYPGCPVGRDDLYAHPGCRYPNSTISDSKIRGKTGLCVDAERVSSWLPVVWSCLESAFINPLSIDPRDRRRYSIANGDDLAVS